jgi:hypothetical protein
MIRFEVDQKYGSVDFYVEDDSGAEHHAGLTISQAREMAEQILRETGSLIWLEDFEDRRLRAKVQGIVREYAETHPGEIVLPCEKHHRLPCPECEAKPS